MKFDAPSQLLTGNDIVNPMQRKDAKGVRSYTQQENMLRLVI